MEDEEDLKSRKERAQVRLQIWLGLSKYQSEWRNSTPGGEVAVYAETVCKIDTFLPGNIFLRALKAPSGLQIKKEGDRRSPQNRVISLVMQSVP